MTKGHTPGPWESDLIFGLHRISGVEGKNHPVADVLRRADARLIAAAPALLEALKEAREYVATFPARDAVGIALRNEALARIDAALKRAGG